MTKVKCLFVLLVISSCCKILIAEVLSVSPFFNFRQGIHKESLLDTKCLECLCDDYLGTGCDEKQLCVNDKENKINGAKIRNCDLLGITYKQWSEEKYYIGNDNETSIDAYVNCKRDPHCSAQVVNDYVAKHIVNCNMNSNTMSCLDFLLIHYFGDKDCKPSELPTLRQERFNTCISKRVDSKPVDTTKQRRSPKMESFKNP